MKFRNPTRSTGEPGHRISLCSGRVHKLPVKLNNRYSSHPVKLRDGGACSCVRNYDGEKATQEITSNVLLDFNFSLQNTEQIYKNEITK